MFMIVYDPLKRYQYGLITGAFNQDKIPVSCAGQNLPPSPANLPHTHFKTNMHTLKSKHQEQGEKGGRTLGKCRHPDWLFRASKTERFQSRFLTVY